MLIIDGLVECLTNWNTIQNSIKRLKKLDDQLSKENLGFTKKEILKFGKEKEKLQRSLRWNFRNEKNSRFNFYN
jgi:ribosomal protein S2